MPKAGLQIFSKSAIEAVFAAALLKPIEKIHLVEKILHSLDKPDPAIEKAWIKESEDRLDAYEKGNLKTIPLKTVLKNIKRK